MQVFSLNAQFARESAMLKLPKERRRWGESKGAQRGGASSETQGQIKGAREILNGRKNIYGTMKSKERREEPLGTMSYLTSSKWSLLYWLLIGARKPIRSQKPPTD